MPAIFKGVAQTSNRRKLYKSVFKVVR